MDGNELSVLHSSNEHSIQGIGIHQHSRSLNLVVIENYNMMVVDVLGYHYNSVSNYFVEVDYPEQLDQMILDIFNNRNVGSIA